MFYKYENNKETGGKMEIVLPGGMLLEGDLVELFDLCSGFEDSKLSMPEMEISQSSSSLRIKGDSSVPLKIWPARSDRGFIRIQKIDE